MHVSIHLAVDAVVFTASLELLVCWATGGPSEHGFPYSDVGEVGRWGSSWSPQMEQLKWSKYGKRRITIDTNELSIEYFAA
jgi:hypothetical protein